MSGDDQHGLKQTFSRDGALYFKMVRRCFLFAYVEPLRRFM